MTFTHLPITNSFIQNSFTHSFILMPNNTKNFGAYMDKTLKIIKLNYLKAFKSLYLDFTAEQWVILDKLYQKDGISQTELANGSFKDAPTVSRIINLLEQKGLVQRERFDNDRRRYKIFLTEKGKADYETALPEVLKLREQGWQGLSDKDYDTYLRIMNQIFKNFE